MSEIRVRTHAIKVKNYGGGMKGVVEIVKEKKDCVVEGKDGKLTIEKQDVDKKVYREIKTTGSDYIIFNCPKCGERNKRCAYDAIVEEDPDGAPIALPNLASDQRNRRETVLVFRCHKCYIMVEVRKPIAMIMPEETILKTL